MPSESCRSIPIILSPPIPDVPAYKKGPKKSWKKKISLYKVKADMATKNKNHNDGGWRAEVGKNAG